MLRPLLKDAPRLPLKEELRLLFIDDLPNVELEEEVRLLVLKDELLLPEVVEEPLLSIELLRSL